MKHDSMSTSARSPVKWFEESTGTNMVFPIETVEASFNGLHEVPCPEKCI